MMQPIIMIHSNRGPVCSVVETFLGRFSSLTYQFISHINPDIFRKWQDIPAWNLLNMLRNHFTYIYIYSGSSNSTTKTWYLFMDCDTWLASQKILNSQPWSRPTRQRSAAHRLRTAVLDTKCYNNFPTYGGDSVPDVLLTWLCTSMWAWSKCAPLSSKM